MPQILIFLIILSVVVLVHELGHFLMAKAVGVKVEEFGFGYPPRLVGKKIRETLYSLNALPFGGFVRLFGEQEAELSLKDKLSEVLKHRAFFHKSKKQRTAVIVAGVVMNFLLGVVSFSLVYSIVGIPETVNYVTVDAVVPGSPAQTSGLREGQRVITLDSQPVETAAQFVKLMEARKGQEVALEVIFKKDRQWDWQSRSTLKVTPRQDPPEGEGPLGVLISNVDNLFYPLWQMPFRGAWTGVKEAVAWGVAMVVGIWTMLVALVTQGIAPQVAGPVGIYRITSAVSQQGILALVKFTGILSINLAVINILPLPALDGGRLIFVFLEKMLGRRVKPVIEYWVNLVGMAILIALMLTVTFREIWQLLQTTSWWEKLP